MEVIDYTPANVASRRKALKATQQDLAVASGLSQSFISDYENGKFGDIGTRTLGKLEQGFKRLEQEVAHGASR